MAPQFLNLLCFQTKNEDVLFADFLHDLDIGPVQRTDSQGAIHGELHIARAGGFCSRHGNVLAEVGCRNDLFGQQHPIIGDEHDFDLTAHARIVIDHLTDIVDQFDDLFGGPIPRCSFASEHVGAGHSRFDLVFHEAQILMHDPHDVEQLPFIFVNTFHMDIEQRMGIYQDLGGLLHHFGEAFFISMLDVQKRALQSPVWRIRLQGSQFVQIGNPAITDGAVQQLGQ